MSHLFPRLRSYTVAALVALANSYVAVAADRLGVIMLHGKQSAPEQMAPLVAAMRAAGHPVEAPEMCWSHRRIYDSVFADCLREIDDAAGRLSAAGASAIAVVGHSLGANAALAYAATQERPKGIVMLAPGHRPERLLKRPDVAKSVASARELVAQGQGDVRGRFADLNGDLPFQVAATPRIYLSFFAEDSAAIMPVNAPKLRIPLLYVVGTRDPLQRGREEIFARAPPHPLNRYATVEAGHFNTLIVARETVVSWLRDLTR